MINVRFVTGGFVREVAHHIDTSYERNHAINIVNQPNQLIDYFKSLFHVSHDDVLELLFGYDLARVMYCCFSRTCREG